MPFSLLPSLLSLILAVCYTPGPANIYAFGCAMEYGRKAAFKMWTGMLAGFTTASDSMSDTLDMKIPRGFRPMATKTSAGFIVTGISGDPGADYHSRIFLKS